MVALVEHRLMCLFCFSFFFSCIFFFFFVCGFSSVCNTGYIKFVLSCASLIASFLLSFCRDIESRSRKSDESSFSFLIDDERFNNESLARYMSAMSEIVFF